MPFAAARSGHPVTAHATGEVVGEIVEQLGLHPDLALLAVTPGHAGALEDAARAVRSLLDPSVLVGWVTDEVALHLVAGDDAPLPGIGLWAAVIGPVAPVRMAAGSAAILSPSFSPAGLLVVGAAGGEATLRSAVGSTLLPVGGAVSPITGAPIVVDDRLHHDGVVGALFGPGVEVDAVVEDGLRAIGPLWTVTDADGPLLHELDGRPALSVLEALARDHVPAGDITLINQTLHLKLTSRPEAAIRVRGGDRTTGAMATDPEVAIGDTVRFAVCDPGEAIARTQLRLHREGPVGALAWRSAGRTAPQRAGPTDDPADDVERLLATGAATVAGGQPAPGGGEVSLVVVSERCPGGRG